MKNLIKYYGKFILASASPRRRKLLELLGIDFSVMAADIDEEEHNNGSDPIFYVTNLAELKAKKIAESINFPAIVIGADTIVVLNGEIINKPNDKLDAYRILRKLSGKTHQVFTGIVLIETNSNRKLIDCKETKVTFRHLTDDEINSYIATGSPLDKAGAYGIQDDFGAVFVSHIEGCYYNIVGLPLELLYRKIIEIVKQN